MDSVLIVAAEASSTLYIKRLLEYWRERGQGVEAFGVGSYEMEQEGFHIVGRSEELAVWGVQEVVHKLGHIRSVFLSLLKMAEKKEPKFALLCDYAGFNLRLAKKLKELNIPVVYYISPQVWAWRKGRINSIRKYVDKMLVLFAFEKDFYDSYGVPVKFVGHPILDEIDEKYFSKEYVKFRRSRYGLRSEDKLLGIMPGSRDSELKYNLSTQVKVVRQLIKEDPKLKVGLLVAPSFEMDDIKARLPRLDFPLILIKDEAFEMIHITDAILCVSGTATLLTGLMRKPLVIMYKVHPLTGLLFKFIKRIGVDFKYVGLVNILLGKEVGAEYLLERASVENLVRATKKILYDPEYIKLSQSELESLTSCLGEKGATERVARELEPFFGRRETC